MFIDMEYKPIAIMILPVFVIGILMLGTMAATVNAQESSNPETTVGEASGADQQTILNIHNRERAAVGTPDLVWSNSLAADAKTWLDTLVAENGGNAERGGLRHDPVNTGLSCTLGTACQGENLAWASRAATPNPPVAPSVEQLVGQWVNEPKEPHASNHYTQMVWKDTKEVGCATANVRGMTSDNWHAVGVYLVCRYSPPGNTVGVPAY
jgi:pathogenesis-related protein 1